MDNLIKVGKAEELAHSHRYILQWIETMTAVITEQQKIAAKRGAFDKNSIGYYLMAMPSEQISSLCVLHVMRHLFSEFVNDIHKEAEKTSAERDEVQSPDVKILAVSLFSELGKLFDKELKQKITKGKKHQKEGNTIQKHLLIDDHEIGAMSQSM